MTQPAIRIGTRGSPLALAQAHETRDRLLAAHTDLSPAAIAIQVIRTSGDKIQDRALAAAGGKGLFTKEIEEALLAGAIDMAVHSMKDVPTILPEGLEISCLLPREDVRDAFISLKAASLDDLAPGALVGTASLRRQAQVLKLRPDLKVGILRGNVETRLRKLGQGLVDATLLAIAGLNRLGLADRATALIATTSMLPAVAQGAVGIERRRDDDAAADWLAPLDDGPTATCVAAERAFLEVLDGSCRTPIAGLARIDTAGGLVFEGEVLSPDGRQCFRATRQGSPSAAARLGAEAGAEIKASLPPGFFVDGGAD